MSLFTFLRPSVKSKLKKSESDEKIPSYEEVLIEVEKRLDEKKTKRN